MKIILPIIMCLLMAACATPDGYIPVIDNRTSGRKEYPRDLRECQTLADTNSNSVNAAASGAVLGAAVGAGVGLLIGIDMSHLVATTAALGAAQGALSENAQGNAMVANCMRGRGYNVLR